MGGYRGLEHTPRWKGVGRVFEGRWKRVEDQAHGFAPTISSDRSREGGPDFRTWILFAANRWDMAFPSAAFMPMAPPAPHRIELGA